MIGIFNKIRKHFYFRSLLDLIKNTKQKQILFNWGNLKSVGILVGINSTNEIETFRKYLLDISIKEKIGFEFLTAHVSGDAKNQPMNSFDPNNYNWKYIPRDQSVQGFIDRDFDLLINLDQSDSLQMLYVAVASNAKFKVGLYQQTAFKIYDITLDYKSTKGQYLSNVGRIISFLKVLNRSNEPIYV